MADNEKTNSSNQDNTPQQSSSNDSVPETATKEAIDNTVDAGVQFLQNIFH